MKIKLTSSVFIHGKGSFPMGTMAEVTDDIALGLIQNKRAVAVEQNEEKEVKPKTTRKKVKKEVE